jgi:hypothetical protein
MVSYFCMIGDTLQMLIYILDGELNNSWYFKSGIVQTTTYDQSNTVIYRVYSILRTL